MRGSIRRRTLADGSVRYDARWRVGTATREKTFRRKKDAEAHLDKVAPAVRDGTYVQVRPAPMWNEDEQVESVLREWLKDLDTREKLSEVKPSTANGYRSVVRAHFVPAFGQYRSDAVTARVVARWRAGMAEKITASKLSAKTFNNALNLLHAILAWARHPARAYLAHDPLVDQKRLTVDRPEADFLEDKEITALLEAAAGDAEANAVVHLALYAGLRRGEVFGLQWQDVEANGETGGRVRVRRSIYQGQVTRPKTRRSERVVDVPQRVLDVLKVHKNATPPKAEGFVFRTAQGTPCDPDNFYTRRFAKLRKAAELRETIGLHSLRHTYASLLIRQGENAKYVSRQLGHASVSFTMDVYGHLFESTSTEAMQRLGQAIPKVKPKPPAKPNLRVVQGGAS